MNHAPGKSAEIIICGIANKLFLFFIFKKKIGTPVYHIVCFNLEVFDLFEIYRKLYQFNKIHYYLLVFCFFFFLACSTFQNWKQCFKISSIYLLFIFYKEHFVVLNVLKRALYRIFWSLDATMNEVL